MIPALILLAGTALLPLPQTGSGVPVDRPDTAAPGVVFSATGGTVTAAGLYTAGPRPGTFVVIATHRALADTSTVSVGSPPRVSELGRFPFGAFDLEPDALTPPFNSSVLSEGPDRILRHLARARAAGARLIVNFAGGNFRNVQNVDGTFSYELWKARLDRFLPLKSQIDEYVRDGTLLAFMLIDEPHSASSWGGQEVGYSMIEQMAEYSKSIWPGLTTAVRSTATWLALAPFRWAYLDAAWAQYSARRGDIETFIVTNVSAARQAGLGLIGGLNVLDGGDGSSRAKGTYRGAYAMTASEIRSYGKALATDPYVCTFQIWKYDPDYVAQRDIADALSEVAQLGSSLSHESCQAR